MSYTPIKESYDLQEFCQQEKLPFEISDDEKGIAHAMVDQLHEFCQERGIPMNVSVCCGYDGDMFDMRQSSTLPIERTCPELLCSNIVGTKPLSESMQVVRILLTMLAGMEDE